MIAFYQEDLKQRFLNRYTKYTTKANYQRVFRKTRQLEEHLQKDLAFFSEDDFKELFITQFKPTTKGSSRTIGRMLTEYLDFAQREGLISENRLAKHPMQYFYQFVQPKEVEFLTADEVFQITTNTLVNAQDSVIVQLLFEGVQGSGVSELCNLKISDVNEERQELTLYDDNPVKKEAGTDRRTISVSKHAIQLILLAYKEKIYHKKNGTGQLPANVKPYIDLAETDHILKTGKTNRHHEEKLSKHTIYNRLEMIRELEELRALKPILNTKTIVKSGMIHKGYLLYKESGTFGLPQIRQVCKQFGVKPNWAIRDYLNMNTIKEVYKN